MKYYKITAEHVRDFTRLLENLFQKRIEVCTAGRDQLFDSIHFMVLHCDLSTAEAVQKMVWEYNHGAYCDLEEITGDEVDELC